MHKKKIKNLAQLHGYWIYKRFLTPTDALPEEQRRAWIDRELRRTLVRACEGTKYYREVFQRAGFDPRTDFKGPQDLAKLPTLTKEVVKERYEDLIDRRFTRLSALAETSGTTGRPLKMLLNERYIALDYACMYKMWAQAGYRFRDPFLALRSYVPSREGEPLWRFDKLQNTLFMSAYHLSPRNIGEFLAEIRRFAPKFIRSYPSSLVVLAEFLQRSGQKLEGVQGLFTASETLTPGERETIEAVFGKRLFDWYGMTEPTLVAFETPEHDGLRIVWQYGYPEFVPDNSLAEGDCRLIATSLHNPAMPFIRYDTGDIVTRHPAEADTLYPTRILRVQGRKDDVIVTPDGRRLPSVNFYTVFRGAKDVIRFQLVQYGTADIVVNLETENPRFESGAEFAELKRELRSRFGGDVRVEYRLNKHFETSRDGKTPVVVRRLANKAVEERKEYLLSSQVAWSRSREGKHVFKLDWNEADCVPSEKVRQRLAQLVDDPHSIFWYPEADPVNLRRALARYTALPENHLLVTHGSDMALAYLVECFLKEGDKVLVVSPTYDNFRAVAEQHGANPVPFDYLGEGEFPLERLLATIGNESPRVIYLTNPNNPIGYLLPVAAIERICAEAAKQSALVIVDEAYFEFARETSTPLLARCGNLAIARTFSKAFGLAGLRVGYVLAAPAIISTLNRVVNPKHLTTFGQIGAEVALDDVAAVQGYVDEVIANRERLAARLRELGYASHPSRANYILIRHPDPKRIVKWMEDRNILVRDRTAYFAGKGHVRVTVGGRASTDALIKAFEEFAAVS